MTLEANLPRPLHGWQEVILSELRELEDALPDLEAAVLAAEEAAASARDLVTAVERLVGAEPWPVAIAGRIVELRARAAVAEQAAVQARHEKDRREATIRDRASALALLDAARDRHEAAIRGGASQRSGAGRAVVKLAVR